MQSTASSSRDFDVVVVGAGTAGVVAAMAAASTGARTCLIDSSGYLGGTTFALGNVVSFHNNRMKRVVAGFPQAIVDRALSRGGAVGDGHVPNPGGMCGTVTLLDSSILNQVTFEIMEELSIELMLHSIMTDVHVEGTRVTGITVANKAGTQEITARCFVDSSGDADLAIKAGAEHEKDQPGKGSLSATTVYRVGKVDHEQLVADLKRHPHRVILLEDPFLAREYGTTPDKIMASKVKTIYDLPYIYLSNIVRDYIPEKDWSLWGITGIEKSQWGKLNPFGSRVHLSASPLSPEIVYVNTTNMHFDATDPVAISHAESEGQRQVHLSLEMLKRYVPGFKDSTLIGSMPRTTPRASRRIMGNYQVTREDVELGHRFEDSIAKGCYPMSVQSLTNVNVRLHLYVENGGDYDIPYRSLVPQTVDGVVV
ncbi:MAG: FAD-dependent oxidoreductase, partial [Vulcanimicrobiaceae bacterium]